QCPFATLDPGLTGTALHRFWNVRGATGFTQREDGTIVFPNLWVLPHSRLDVAIDATVDLFTEGDGRIALSPVLKDSDGNAVPLVAPTVEAQVPVGAWAQPLPSTTLAEPASAPSSSAAASDASSAVSSSGTTSSTAVQNESSPTSSASGP